jgi:[acyl-carrier-protein] S-malonyltransferase
MQVSAPVRWDECMRSMAGLGVSAFIELPPGGTLTGLARRALPGLAMAALKTPDHLDTARTLLAEHGRPEPPQAGPVPDWRLIVAPLAGTFRASADDADAVPGAHVRPGATLGHVEVRSGQHTVTPPFSATIIEWLVEDGDPVAEGQPLVRLQPESA